MVWPRRLLIAGLLLMTALHGLSCFPRTNKPASKVIVLGLDAGTWDLLDGFMERGLLPNLARLRDKGVSGPLQSTEPSSSPVIWTSIATGKVPEKHGITFFVRFPEGKTGKPAPVTSNERKVKAIWNILSDFHEDVAVVGWYVTWPVEAVDGRMISDRAHYGDTDDESFPPGTLQTLTPMSITDVEKIIPRFMALDFDPTKVHAGSKDPVEQIHYLVFDRFVRAYVRDSFYVEATEHLLTDGPLPRLTMLYLRGTDDVQHGFWKFMQPELFDGVTAEEAEHFGKVIERYWQWTDEQVGRILSHFDDDTLVIVVSDHGAGPAVGPFRVITPEYMHLSGSHRRTGVLIASGPGVRKGATIDGATIYDITPSLLHYLSLPVADDMDGHVLEDLFVPSIATRSDPTVPTFDDEARAGGAPLPSKVDDEVLEHLRSLGYIE